MQLDLPMEHDSKAAMNNGTTLPNGVVMAPVVLRFHCYFFFKEKKIVIKRTCKLMLAVDVEVMRSGDLHGWRLGAMKYFFGCKRRNLLLRKPHSCCTKLWRS